MSEIVKIVLYGSLRNIKKKSPHPEEKHMNLTESKPLKNVIHDLGVQDESVQLVMRNHHAVSRDAIINPGDRVAFFPKEYPIYPDWNHFRF